MISDPSRLFEIASELMAGVSREREVELLEEVIPILEGMVPLAGFERELVGVDVSSELVKMRARLEELKR